MKRTDLKGQRFGSWTVVIRADNSDRGAARWACKCDCGGAAIVRADALKSGSSPGCGACDRETPRGWSLARNLGDIERKRELTVEIEKRLQGLSEAERLVALTDLARRAEQARR
jgi:hypothetical protein